MATATQAPMEAAHEKAERKPSASRLSHAVRPLGNYGAAGNLAIQRAALGSASSVVALRGGNMDGGGCSCGGDCDECKKKQLQLKSAGPLRNSASLDRNDLDSASHPLDTALREGFESSMNADLAGVRIHRDAAAARAASNVNAKAFTLGQDIYFSHGLYAPETTDGRRLLAHELTHTLQQPPRGSSASLPEVLPVTPQTDPSEREADSLADGVMSGESIKTRIVTHVAPQLQRDLLDDNVPARSPAAAFPNLQQAIRSSDTPLETGNRGQTESGFGHFDSTTTENDVGMVAFQENAGNFALQRLTERSLSVQRKPETTEPPVIPEAVFTLDEKYRAALSAGDWEQAAVLLNGFNDADIQARVNDTTELPPPSRLQLRLHTPDWAFRVRRPLLLRDYEDAKAAGQWTEAATLLNGFNDTDIQLFVSQLTPLEVGPMVHGAREALKDTTLNRVLRAIAHRYDEVSPDPLGTKVLTVVGLMQSGGISVKAASAYVQLKLGVSVAATATSASSAEGQGAPVDHTADIKVLAAAMSGGVVPAAGGPGAPKRPQPEQLDMGNLAHQVIGDRYCELNSPCVSDLSVSDILSFAKGTKGLSKAIQAAKFDLFLQPAGTPKFFDLDSRPDIVDFGKAPMQIFEIKRAGSAALAVSEAKLYIELFDSLDIPGISFTLGHPGNPGTRGEIPLPEGILVWASPLPGAIVYEFTNPPFIRGVQEALESEGKPSPSLVGGLGPESMIALGVGVAGAAVFVVGAAVAGWEITPAAVATYETLIPLLAAAARAAGQLEPVLSTP